VPLSAFCSPAKCSFDSVGTTFMLASKHIPPFVASAISCHMKVLSVDSPCRCHGEFATLQTLNSQTPQFGMHRMHI